MGDKRRFQPTARHFITQDEILVGYAVVGIDNHAGFLRIAEVSGDDVVSAKQFLDLNPGIQIDRQGDIVARAFAGFQVLNFGLLA